MKIPAFIVNAIATSRSEWLRNLLLGGVVRDIDKECGHPYTVTVDDCYRAYRRGDVAARVVEIYPDESWCEDPQIYETEDQKETEFEKRWQELVETLPIFPVLHRADVLCGIGRFGVILLGIDDGQELDKPIAAINEKGEPVGTPEHKLLYMRPLDETVVKVKETQRDVSNPRYGLPTFYEVMFSEPNPATDTSTSAPPATRPVNVHWSRVIHLADNRFNSEVYGMPRLERVFNRMLDLKKIAGGSGEMFWKGGFPGLSLETQPGLGDDVELDTEKTKEELLKYMEGLQRYIATTNMTAKSLLVQVADPSPHAMLQLKLIAIAMAVPWRVFAGSEQAQLASEQDTRAWNKRLNRRREEYLSPFVIRPFVDRLIRLGVLPNPGEGFIVDWGDLNAPSDKEQAEVAKVQTEALANYTQKGVDLLIPPFLFLTLVMGYSDEEAKSIVADAEARQTELGVDLGERNAEAEEEMDEEEIARNGEISSRI